MKILKVPLVFLFILIGCQAAFSQIKYRGTVVDTVDGKTVVIELPTRNRLTAELQFIEVPEPGQPLHQTVKDHLRKLLLGREVDFWANQMTRTKTIGQVVSDGVDISQQMIRDGAAWYAAGETPNEIYKNDEAQARAEKRGIWGVANLKPAWEFRAERDKTGKPPETKVGDANQRGGGEYIASAKPPRNLLKRPAAAPYVNGEMWANVDDYSKIKEAIISNGLVTAYNPYMDLSYISTPNLEFDIGGGNIYNAMCRIKYFYKGAQPIPGGDTFIFSMQAQSKKAAFAESNNLTVIADRSIINLGKAKRVARQVDSSVVEILVYKVSRASLEKIAAAKNVTVKVGGYSTAVSGKHQKMLKTLLKDTGE